MVIKMDDILISIDNRDGRLLTAYTLRMEPSAVAERRIDSWIIRALCWTSFETERFYVLDDAKSCWSFGFSPSEGEFLAVQKLLTYWQFCVQFHYRPSPLVRISPSVYASVYENIVGLRIWLRDNVGPVTHDANTSGRDRQAAYLAVKIYLRVMDYWLHAIAAGGEATTQYNNFHPVRCFRFVQLETTNEYLPSDYFFPFNRVEVANQEFGAHLSSVVRSFRDTFLKYMGEIPIVVVRN